MTATFDFSEVDAFAAALDAAAAAIPAAGAAVVAKGALNIKTDAKANLGQHRTLWRLPGAITYDIETVGGVTMAEIGPDQDISGLGMGTEMGSVHHAPMPFLHPAFDAEVPRFEVAADALLDVVMRL